MKRISFFALAVAGLLLTACSEKDVIVGSGTPETPQSGALSDGFMALNINLPTTSSSSPAFSRAISNDDFDDGLPAEYQVTDCALLLFDEGSTAGEGGATLVFAADVTPTPTTDNDNDNITTSYRVVTKISGHDTNKKLYALAALNYKNVITITNGKATTKAGTEITNLAGLHAAIGTTDLTYSTEYEATNGNYFFMTNAVLSTKPGGGSTVAPSSGDVFQLAELDKDKIYTSETTAQNNPAGEILVERAVAKATLSLNGVNVGTTTVGSNNTAKITKVEWVIDNMEPETYIARNPGDNSYISYKSDATSSPGYRFVSHTSTKDATFLGTDKDYYRTYWCVDPQYSGTNTKDLLGYSENPMNGCNTFKGLGENNPIYCYENTFDVANQTYGNTTRAIIKVTLEDGAKFYTLNGTGDYYTETTLASHIKTYLLGNENVKNTIQQYYKQEDTYEYSSLANYIKWDDFTANAQTCVCTLANVTLETTEDNAENYPFKSGNENFNEGVEDAVKEALTAAMNSFNAHYVITEYAQGEMYYEARFWHFGNELTPWHTGATWENPAPQAGVSVGDAYPGCNSEVDTEKTRAANRYLGRYGMVRNNWYDVEVTSFLNFGSPVDPTGKVKGDSTPDDHLENNIAVKIHVLSWAKRKQSWSF